MSVSVIRPGSSSHHRVALFTALAALAVVPTQACRGSRRAEERPVVARLSGTPIYADELKRELRRLRLDDGSGMPAGNEAVQKQVLLDNTITRRLLLTEAERNNVIVGTDEVQAAFARARSGWDEGYFNTELGDNDITASEFKAELREMLVIRKYFRDHVYSRLVVTDAEIEAYLAAHPEVINTPERVHARYLVVKTEEEAQRILKELSMGLAFEDAAIKYSLSPDGRNGGDLGLFARGVMPRVFDEVCFALSPGQVSKVIAGEYGFYLFKVIEKQPTMIRPTEAVRDDVETRLRREKERVAEETKIAELRRAVTIEIEEGQLAAIH